MGKCTAVHATLAEARTCVRAHRLDIVDEKIPTAILLALRESDLLDLVASLEYLRYPYRLVHGPEAARIHARYWQVS